MHTSAIEKHTRGPNEVNNTAAKFQKRLFLMLNLLPILTAN